MKELIGTTIRKINRYNPWDSEDFISKTITAKFSNDFYDKFINIKRYLDAMNRYITHKLFKKVVIDNTIESVFYEIPTKKE